MKTVKLALPWTVKRIAEALDEPVDFILKRLYNEGAPKSVSANTTVDFDTAKILALKYCVYLEIDDEGHDRRTSNPNP